MNVEIVEFVAVLFAAAWSAGCAIAIVIEERRFRRRRAIMDRVIHDGETAVH